MAASNPARTTPIWARPEPATRKPRFSREQIAAAALAIADADGFEAVTMRRIAAALGAGTMSLYRYIETKDDLLALIDDAILGEALVPSDLPADWREALTLIARQSRRAYLRHPWAVQALQGPAAAGASVGPYAGPNSLRHFEQCLAAMDGAPLSLPARLDLLAIVDDFVYGHLLRAAEITGRLTAGRAGARSEPAAALEFLQTQLGSGDFPHLRVLASDPAVRAVADPAELDGQFDRGLRMLIDGAAAGLLIRP
jgi:AcrR family transcriptional regulator